MKCPCMEADFFDCQLSQLTTAVFEIHFIQMPQLTTVTFEIHLFQMAQLPSVANEIPLKTVIMVCGFYMNKLLLFELSTSHISLVNRLLPKLSLSFFFSKTNHFRTKLL